MPDTYAYKARDKGGNVLNGTIVADNEALVLARLREQGFVPLEVDKQKRGMNIELTAKKVKFKELSVFARQFATMVNSGLPILRSLAILAEQTENPELARVLGEIRTDVEQGSSLSGAMVKHPKVFNDLFVAMVKSGETGGSLDDVLLRLADMIEAEVRLRGKIKSAMTYPIAVVALVVLIMSAMLLFVVPQFQTIYGSLGGSLPLPTRDPAHDVQHLQEVLVHRADRHVRLPVLLQALEEDGQRSRVGGQDEAAGADLRDPVPEDGAVAVRIDLLDAAALGRADPAVAGDRGRDGEQPGRVRRRERRAGTASAKASRWPSRWPSTRSSRRWSCR